MAADTAGVKLSATANSFIISTGILLDGLVYPPALGMVKDATHAYTWSFAAVVSLLVMNVLVVTVTKDMKGVEGLTLQPDR